MSDQSLYDALGVGRGATADEIQRAYRKLARTWHPDVNKSPDAEDRFKKISEAYDVLSDPDLRKKYDAFGEDFRRVPDDVSAADWARAQRRSARPQQSSQDVFVDFGDLGGGSASMEDLFGGLFGQGRATGPRNGPDQQVEVGLTVEEAFRGGRHKVSLTGGSGKRDFTVTVPPGVIDGQHIRLAGQGAAGRGGGAPGDLYLIVRLHPDHRYRVTGRDIYVDLPISPWEAALGATVAVAAPAGDAKIKIPSGTSSGQTLRLKAQGMPNPSGASGDLLAVVKIVVPKTLNSRERELFAELAAASGFDPRSRR